MKFLSQWTRSNLLNDAFTRRIVSLFGPDHYIAAVTFWPSKTKTLKKKKLIIIHYIFTNTNTQIKKKMEVLPHP